MDLSKVDKYGLTHDLIKVTLFNILAHIAMHHGYNEPLLTYKFLFQLAFILLGFTAFYVFIEPHIKKYWTPSAKEVAKFTNENFRLSVPSTKRR